MILDKAEGRSQIVQQIIYDITFVVFEWFFRLPRIQILYSQLKKIHNRIIYLGKNGYQTS